MSKRVGRHLTRRSLSLDEFWEQEKDDLFKDVVAKTPKSNGSSDPAVQTLNDVNVFFSKHNREPKLDGPLEEKVLARKLNGIRKLSGRNDLREADIHGLLFLKISDHKAEELNGPIIPLIDISNDDALADSLLGMLGGDNLKGLFDTVVLKQAKPKNTQDRVGQRTPCSNFTPYIPIFNQIKDKIDNSPDSIIPFKGTSKFNVGDVFIWGGITCFVERELKMEYDSEGKPNPRLKIIFDNGMYADMLYQSFSQGMYRSPGTRRIRLDISHSLGDLSKPLAERYGNKTGEIYFLASHSNAPEVTKFKNLIKVGVTTNHTPLRTRNADSESTYLYAPVRILRILPCYNINVQGLESMIHTRLHEFRKEIKLRNKKTGKELVAKEWFDVSLEKAVSVAINIVRDSIGHITLDENDNLYSNE
ncbi:GIY-YIG nuclease family protein [Shewanella baltica]|uniref:GIY-YIG nuclease family protein n=1 Tax=Shewanella baltica TaxID=62322 RepID=UPI00217D2C6A|nr:GIY-YIG nuclease family protein [Shewanella baltica]MCS6097698.1 GIY-YIG nuclease family protein [Shewanella baltica]MCS6228806.1 GIY-YIG nuclease family protein [Shewanella baltica]